MTIDEFRDYFVNGYRFEKRTKMGAPNFHNWVRRGYIPLKSQQRLQDLTNGDLVARFEDDPNVNAS